MSIKKPDGIQIELDSTKIVDAISKSIIREEEKKNEKKLRNFAILATGNVRASRYIKEPKINMTKLFSGIFTVYVSAIFYKITMSAIFLLPTFQRQITKKQ